jgi:hypothetical protein
LVGKRSLRSQVRRACRHLPGKDIESPMDDMRCLRAATICGSARFRRIHLPHQSRLHMQRWARVMR